MEGFDCRLSGMGLLDRHLVCGHVLYMVLVCVALGSIFAPFCYLPSRGGCLRQVSPYNNPYIVMS